MLFASHGSNRLRSRSLFSPTVPDALSTPLIRCPFGLPGSRKGPVGSRPAPGTFSSVNPTCWAHPHQEPHPRGLELLLRCAGRCEDPVEPVVPLVACVFVHEF